MRALFQLLLLPAWCLASTSTQPDPSAHPFTSTPQLPFQIPHTAHNPNANSESWFNRARDRLIRSIWHIPSVTTSDAGHGNPPQRSNPPPQLLARYGGDLVLRFDIKSAEEAEALAEAVNVLFLDVWEFNSEWVDIRLSKDVIPSLLGLLPVSLRNAHTPLMHDLAQAIFESYPSMTFVDPTPPAQQPSRPFSADLRQSSDETNIFFREYQPLSVIIPWMRLLRSLFPTHVRMISIGISYEGRDIPALRVGVHPTNSEKPSEPRKTIIVAGGSHAREWISTSTVNYVAYSFITSYGRSRSITKLLEKFDFVFIPTLNPDGYVYTWETDRLWRKNRQQTSLRFCQGLDLDRSYGFEWSNSHSNHNPCSESYAGDRPFEAVESQRFAAWVRNETENNNVKLAGFLDLHSYSQQVLYPYSYSCTSAPPSLENLEELAIGLAKAIRITNGERYGVTSACEGSINLNNLPAEPTPKSASAGKETKPVHPRIETTGGSALDYFYRELRATYAYQIKLRDTGSYGFLLPAHEIVPTGKEAFAAVEYFGEYLMGNKGIESEDVNADGRRGGGGAVSDDAVLSHPGAAGSDDEGEGDGEGEEVEDLEESDLVEEAVDVGWELRRRRR